MGEEVTPTRWAVLAKLYQTGPSSQNRLGRLTAMDAATIKGVVDRLIERRLIETRPDPGIDELSGVSVFYRDEDGAIFHCYSLYGRGGEMFLPVYAWLDIVPKGRNETKNGDLTDWVRRHDRYPDDGHTRAAAQPARAEGVST